MEKKENPVLNSLSRSTQMSELETANMKLSKMASSLKLTPQQLFKNDERSRSMIEDLFGLIFEIDSDGKCIYASPKCKLKLGYEPEELINRIYFDIIHPDDIESVRSTILNNTSLGIIEYRILHKNGTWVWFESAGRSYPDSRYTGITAVVSWDITKRKQTELELIKSHEMYRKFIESTADMVFLKDDQFRYMILNKNFLEFLGGEIDNIIGKTDYDILNCQTAYELRQSDIATLNLDGINITLEEIGGKTYESRKFRVALQNGKYGVGGYLTDVTEVLKAQELLTKSEEQFRQMFSKQHAVMFIIDPDTLLLLDANEAACNFYGYSHEDFRLRGVTSLTVPGYEDTIIELVEKSKIEQSYHGTSKHFTADGKVHDVEIYSSLIDLTEKQLIFCIIHDITERMKAEEHTRYIGFHDMLTGLKNRSYFDEEMYQIEKDKITPLCMILFDIDGLKLVNDALGHERGDFYLIQLAGILKECFRDADILSRIGGDEFAVVKKGVDSDYVKLACTEMSQKIDQLNLNNDVISLSVSYGYTISGDIPIKTKELFSEADRKMSRAKLHKSQSIRSTIVNTVMKVLAERDFITEGHTDRIQDLASLLGRHIGLPENRISDLRLLGRFHDIGKVGIKDDILFKPNKLTPEETTEMHKHCEIGRRIALASPDLAHITDWILMHHEWWNGNGYPLGLSGEEIPLECRIISIVDAYDTMTHERLYKAAMSQEEAILELKRNAGTQFDPYLVEMLSEILDKSR